MGLKTFIDKAIWKLSLNFIGGIDPTIPNPAQARRILQVRMPGSISESDPEDLFGLPVLGLNHVWNDNTGKWEKAYLAQQLILLASAGRTASSKSDVMAGLGLYRDFTVLLDVTTVTVAGTLNVYIQHTPDGVVWDDLISFTQFAAATGQKIAKVNGRMNAPAIDYTPRDASLAAGTVIMGPWGDKMRVKYTIAGGGNYTFGVRAFFT